MPRIVHACSFNDRNILLQNPVSTMKDESSEKKLNGINVPKTLVKGLFSAKSTDKIGTGATARKSDGKTYWMIEEAEDGTISRQALNKNLVPSGEPTPVDREEFFEKYSPEPEFYQAEVYPKIKQLEESVKRAEEQREKGAIYSAEFEFNNALSVDEESIRANFGLGLTYMDMGESSKAEDILNRIVTLDAAFSPRHKHLFNEFGINLRKCGMLDQAVAYYTRALEITDGDENLHYNMARAYFEKGDLDNCTGHLDKVVALNPDHEEGNQFLEFINRAIKE